MFEQIQKQRECICISLHNNLPLFDFDKHNELCTNYKISTQVFKDA